MSQPQCECKLTVIFINPAFENSLIKSDQFLNGKQNFLTEHGSNHFGLTAFINKKCPLR